MSVKTKGLFFILTKKNVCTEVGCMKRPHARGLCGTHYFKKRREVGFENSAKCSQDGCDKPVVSKGLCDAHYNSYKAKRRKEGAIG